MIRIYHGQTYALIGIEGHTRRDGSETRLARWHSNCAQCGEAFTFTMPEKSKRFEPNRRCAKHRRPGQRVRIIGETGQ